MKRFYVTICYFLLFALQTAYAQKAPNVQGEPVIIKNDTLFKFYNGQGLFTAKERARTITRRIEGLLERLDFNPDSLVLKNDTAISIIFYQSQIILSVSNKDASFSELSRTELAASYLKILKKELGDVFANNSAKQIVINISEALAVIALVILLIWAINRCFRWIIKRAIASSEKKLDKLPEVGAQRTYARRLLPFIANFIKIIRLIIIILLIYLALPVLFFIFPASKPIASQLMGYIVDPLKSILLALVHYIPNLLTIGVIYLFTRYVVKLVRMIANEIANETITIKGFYPDWAIPTYKIVKVLLYAFMFVVIFPYLPGSQSKVFQGVTVFLGVLFSLGSSSAISNMVAGIVLTYMRPFKIGDRIMVGEIRGDVIEKNLLVTRIRTIKNEDVTIPNGAILSGHTINYTTSAQTLGLILHTSITIGYDAPWKTIHELMINAALATDGILKEPKPFMLQTDLNDFNVTYEINAYTELSHNMAKVYSALHQNIQDKFNEAGVEIMSPHYTALRDGNHIQIPDDYVAKNYKTPGFNIKKEE